jgi:hypothetical protein
MKFDGKLLERGFWLYVWKVSAPTKMFLYVGRTGDSSSRYANSPFNRIGQHLDIRDTAKGNAMARQLKSKGINPQDCSFEMIAIGPIFPEQKTMENHKPYRDKVAALEKAASIYLKTRGYDVLGVHHASQQPDAIVFTKVIGLLDNEFPDTKKSKN